MHGVTLVYNLINQSNPRVNTVQPRITLAQTLVYILLYTPVVVYALEYTEQPTHDSIYE